MRASALVIIAAASLIGGLIALACSTPAPDRGSCPNDLPQACASNVPSYKTDITPVIGNKCNQCHTDGGPGSAKFDFSTYNNVYAGRSSMLNQVYACRMPPSDASALTSDERASLLNWFVCHAPNN